MDLGQGRRGVDMGPSAFRVADIHQRVRDLGYQVTDSGDIGVTVRETRDPGHPRLRYLTEIRETCAIAIAKSRLGEDPGVTARKLADQARLTYERAWTLLQERAAGAIERVSLGRIPQQRIEDAVAGAVASDIRRASGVVELDRLAGVLQGAAGAPGALAGMPLQSEAER